VQWHPTILSKMAIIPQRTLNAYAKSVDDLSKYRDGDFVVHFVSCATAGPKNCELEAEPFSKQWQTIFNAQR
jgi:mannan polymerase II complex MNN11 subunit